MLTINVFIYICLCVSVYINYLKQDKQDLGRHNVKLQL